MVCDLLRGRSVQSPSGRLRTWWAAGCWGGGGGGSRVLSRVPSCASAEWGATKEDGTRGRLKGPLVLRAEITKSDRGATRGGLGRAWPAAVGRSKDNRSVPGVRLAGRWPRLQPLGSRLGSRLATRFGPAAGRHARVEARTAAEKDSAGAHGRRGKDRLALTTAAPCVENVQLAEREEAGSWDSPPQPRSDAGCSHHECDLVVRRGRLS